MTDIRDERVPATGLTALEVSTINGDVDVRARGGVTEAVVTLRAGPGQHAATLVQEASVERRNGTLRVEVPRRTGGAWLGADSVDVDVSVPPGLDVGVETGSGDITLYGACAGVTLSAGSGDLAVAEATGAHLSAGTGDVHVDRATWVRARVGSGDVRLAEVQDEVRVKGGSGDVTVQHARGDVEINGGSGDIAVGAVEEGNVQLQTASGDISVGIAQGRSVHLDCTSLTGTVTSDLEATAEPGDAERGVHLKVRAVNGDVRVRRASG